MNRDYTLRNQERSTDPEPGPTMDSFKRTTRLFRARDSAEDADLVNGRINFASWIPLLVMLAITGVYVVLEAKWNLELITSVSSATTTPDDLDWMVTEGRILSAFGLAWVLTKSMFFRKTDSMVGGISAAVLIVGLTVLAYAGIGRLYDGAINALSPAQSLQMYKTAVHRTWSVEGILQKSDSSSKDPIAVVLWPLKIADPTQLEQIESVFKDRAENASTQAAELAHKEWPNVEARLSGNGDPELLRKEFQDLYTDFIVMSLKTKGRRYGSVEESQFAKIMGMAPNPNARPEDFARMLLNSGIRHRIELGRMYLDTKGGTVDPVVYSNAGITLKGSDFKNVRSEGEFVKMVVDKAENALVTNAPNLMTVKTKPGAHDVIAAAMVPPLAMVLSCVGVLLGAGNFLGLLLMRAPVLRHIPQPLVPLLFAATVVAATPATTHLPGLDGGLAWLHSSHPLLAWILERVVTLEYWALALTG